MRLVVRKERPHPGAQLRFTDADGLRLTAFATNTTGTPIAALELRHRQRARAEDRIQDARATGLRHLPPQVTAVITSAIQRLDALPNPSWQSRSLPRRAWSITGPWNPEPTDATAGPPPHPQPALMGTAS